MKFLLPNLAGKLPMQWYDFLRKMYQTLGFDEYKIYSELNTYLSAVSMDTGALKISNGAVLLPDAADNDLTFMVKLPNNYKKVSTGKQYGRSHQHL